MKQTRFIMGMPVTCDIPNCSDTKVFRDIFSYFRSVDFRFSTYKKNSEISKINRGEIDKKDYSPEMKEVFALCEKTKEDTDGYFDINKNGKIDPSGLVKGWAIRNAAQIIRKAGYSNFYIDAGSDIEIAGKNHGQKWRLGIRNPFEVDKIVKVLNVTNAGVATSGNYERGEHIYNPKNGKRANEIASITVIGPNIYEADRFATAAYAAGLNGIKLIERQKGLEGYMIERSGIATYTSGFEKYIE